MKISSYLLFIFLACCYAQAEDVLQLSLEPALGMTRAELFYLKPDNNKNLKAVLILCPGANGNGKGFLMNPKWKSYAEKMGIGLVGLSFASEAEELKDRKNRNGYYYAGNGSGKLLLDGLRSIYKKDMPLLMYGFSGGAHFTSRFVEWKKDGVIAWCAYSAGWWDKPLKSSVMPPGIIACGTEDERLDASQVYFWDGRSAGKPWLWIDVKGIGHVSSRELDSFVMDYFETILRLGDAGKPQPFKKGLWVDIYEHAPAKLEDAWHRPCAVAWLPDQKLLDKWLLLTKGTQNE